MRKQVRDGLLAFYLFLIACAIAGAMYFDYWDDRRLVSEGQEHRALVLQKYRQQQGRARAHVLLLWLDNQPQPFNVSSRDYRMAAVRDTVTIRYFPDFPGRRHAVLYPYKKPSVFPILLGAFLILNTLVCIYHGYRHEGLFRPKTLLNSTPSKTSPPRAG